MVVQMVGCYRKSSIKHRSAYVIFPVMGAALIQERRLFESGINVCFFLNYFLFFLIDLVS